MHSKIPLPPLNNRMPNGWWFGIHPDPAIDCIGTVKMIIEATILPVENQSQVHCLAMYECPSLPRDFALHN